MDPNKNSNLNIYVIFISSGMKTYRETAADFCPVQQSAQYGVILRKEVIEAENL